MMRRLILTAMLVAGCAAPVASEAPPTPTPVPTLAPIVGWPTVEQAVAYVKAEGYNLVNDTAGSGESRWTGPDPRSSPIEILGALDNPAKIAVVMEVGSTDTTALEAVLTMFSEADKQTILGAQVTALEDLYVSGESAEVTQPLEHGEVEVSAFFGDDMFTFLRP